ncbi:MAG TPA: hypothetical protein VHS03_09900 [Gaiellaceae bacterium]|nr:hypothetical protein [Gaiellaceae bacterium]
MSQSAKRRSLLAGISLGVCGTLTLVVALGLVAGAGASSAASPPSNTSPPTISGEAQKGQTLHASPGVWSGSSPISFAYRWQRCNAGGGSCGNIGGATHRDYTLVQADVGNTVRVVVTASNSAGSATAASSPSAMIAAAQAPANTAPPTITGTPQLGATLTANTGSWTGPGPITFTFQWLRCDQNGGACGNIAGATNQTLVLGTAEVGHAIRVRVRAKNQFGATSATTVPTAAVSGTANGCPIGLKTVSVSQVNAPARLIVDGMNSTPSIIRRDSKQVTVRFHVSNTCGQTVQGALVYATAVPFNQLSNAPTIATDSTGWAVITFQTRTGFPVSKQQQLMTIFVRASKPGDSDLAGVSSRRLVSLPVLR